MKLQKKFQISINILCVLVFCLLLLGNLVRNMKAGLSCPDWPLCYGELIPHFNPLVGYEFSHRVLAGLISILFTFLFVAAIQYKLPKRIIVNFVVSLVILLSQIILGGLTVLKYLDSNVVATHLITGLTFFLSICFLKFQLHDFFQGKQKSFLQGPLVFKLLVWVGFISIFVQSFLGGLVASNYAGLACQGFPTCNGEWWPSMEGSVFFHMIHRLMAFFIVALGIGFYYGRRKFKHQEWFTPIVRKVSSKILFLISIQVLVGISNIFLAIPTVLSIVHLGLAALLLFYYLKLSVEIV